MRMRSSSCPHIDFLGSLNRQLATPSDPSPDRLKELNSILLTLHTMLPQSCADEQSTDEHDDDEEECECRGELSDQRSQYTSVPGLLPATNGRHLELVDHQLLSIGYTLLAVKVELKSLAEHLPDHASALCKLESQVEELEFERTKRLKELGAAHDIGKDQLAMPLQAAPHSPLKPSSRLMGSVEIIDEIPDEAAYATFRSPAPLPHIPYGTEQQHHQHQHLSSSAQYPSPEDDLRRCSTTTAPSGGGLLIPGSRSIDGSSTGNSSIWQVTPVHALNDTSATAASSFPAFHHSGMRARSDDCLTDSDICEFPSSHPQSLKQNSFQLPLHTSTHSIGHGSCSGGAASNSASRWSLKSTPLGTSPCLHPSLNSGHSTVGMHMSLESLPASPKVTNGAFDRPPSRRMSIAGRRSVTKFSVSPGSITSGKLGTSPDSVFPPPPTEEDLAAMGARLSVTSISDGRRSSAAERDSLAGRKPSSSSSVFGSAGPGQLDTFDRNAQHPRDRAYSSDSGNKGVEEDTQPGMQASDRTSTRHSTITSCSSDAESITSERPGSGRMHSSSCGSTPQPPPSLTTAMAKPVAVHADGTVRMSVQRLSSSRRRKRALSASSFTSTKIDQRLVSLQEIITSEKEYVQALRTIQTVYANPMTSLRILSAQERSVIFPRQLLAIQHKHERFLQSLETSRANWSASSMLGNSFTILSNQEKQTHSLLNCYRLYLENFADAMQVLSDKIRVSACVRGFIEDASLATDDSTAAPGLSMLLLSPIKRLPQYITHLKALLKSTPEGHPDKKAFLQAVQVLNNALPAMQDTMQASTKLFDRLAPDQSRALMQANDSIRQSLRYSAHAKARASQRRSRQRSVVRSRYSERPVDVDGLDMAAPGLNSLSARRQASGEQDVPEKPQRRKPIRKMSLKYMVNIWQQRQQGQGSASSSSRSSAESGSHTRTKRNRRGLKGLGRAKTFSAGDRKIAAGHRMSKSYSADSLHSDESSSDDPRPLTRNGKNAFQTGSVFTMPGRYDKQARLPPPSSSSSSVDLASDSNNGGKAGRHHCDSPKAGSAKHSQSSAHDKKKKVKSSGSSEGGSKHDSPHSHLSQAREQSAKLASERLKLTSDSSPAASTPATTGTSPSERTQVDDAASNIAIARNSMDGGQVRHNRRNNNSSGDNACSRGKRGTPAKRKECQESMATEIIDDCDRMTNAIINEFSRQDHGGSPLPTANNTNNHFQSPHRTRQVAIRGPNRNTPSAGNSPYRTAAGTPGRKLPSMKPNIPPALATPPDRCSLDGGGGGGGDTNSTCSKNSAATPTHAAIAKVKSAPHPLKIAGAVSSLPQSPLSKKNSVASFGDVPLIGNGAVNPVTVVGGNGELPHGIVGTPVTLPSPVTSATHMQSSSTDAPLSDSVFTPSPPIIQHQHDANGFGLRSPEFHAAVAGKSAPSSLRRRRGLTVPPSPAALVAPANHGAMTTPNKDAKLALFSLPQHPDLSSRHALTNGLAKKLAQPGFSYVPSASGRNILIVKGPKKTKTVPFFKLKFWKNRGAGGNRRQDQNNTEISA